MHQSLLILAAPERWSGLQFEAMSSAIGPARCSAVWKHNAGILMDRTACPLSLSWLSTLHTHKNTHTRVHTHAYAQARKHRQTLCTKPEIFSQMKPRLDRFGSAYRPYLLAVGAGWWHVLKEAGSRSQSEPSQNGHKLGAHAFMFRYYANWSAHGPPKHIESSRFWILWFARPQVRSSCGKSSTDPVPSSPHPLCRQRAGENRIRDTDEAPLRYSRPRRQEAGVAKAHRHVTNYQTQREKYPNISKLTSECAVYWWFKGPDLLVSHPRCSLTPRLHRAKRLPLRYQCLSTPLPPPFPPSFSSSPSFQPIRWQHL